MTTKRTLLTSVVSLVLCFCMLLGTTFAWFTDAVISGGNIIASGNLDAKMHWSDKLLEANSDEWQDADGNPIFTYNNWEPGYTEVRYVKVSNAGSLNFRWNLTIEADGEVTDLADVIDVYYVNPVTNELTKDGIKGLTSVGTLTDVLENKTGLDGRQLTPDNSVILAIAFHMDELAGNDYQGKSLCEAGFSLKLIATQDIGESDSFGDDYDANAEWPYDGIKYQITKSIANKVDATGKLTEVVDMDDADNGIYAQIPEGVKIAEGATKLTFTVTSMDKPNADVNTTSRDEILRSVDIHVEGVAEDNTVPMTFVLEELFPKGLNGNNVKLYHVEGTETKEMTLVDAPANHNEFSYDPNTGDSVVTIATFSEVATYADTDAGWNGTTVTPYTVEGDTIKIANAEQFAYFRDQVDAGNDFAGKTVKLIADINLNGHLFDPIGWGYDNAAWNRNKAEGKVFKGCLDGGNHTIYGLYQNGWDLDPDQKNYSTYTYTNCGFGLFASALDATFENLNIDGADIRVECVETGVLVGLAQGKCTFRNINILGCRAANYQRPVGGVVGEVSPKMVNGVAQEGDASKHTFDNVYVDSNTVVGSMWGDFDAPVGGVIGAYWDDVGATTVYMNKVTVACRLDVYNDVTSTYQWYAYRRAGMLIGNTDNANGHTATAPFLECSNVIVFYGDWADYHYCEFHDSNPNWPWVRVEPGEYCSGYSNPRWGNATDPVTKEPVVDSVHNHGTGEGHMQSISFHQLYGGGQGVYGEDTHPNVSEGIYTVTYMDHGEILHVDYVTDNTKEYKIDNGSTDGDDWSINDVKAADGRKLLGWVDANNNTFTGVKANNTANVIIYPKWENEYVVRCIDTYGNVKYYAIISDANTELYNSVANEINTTLTDIQNEVDKGGKVIRVVWKDASGKLLTTKDADGNIVPEAITSDYFKNLKSDIILTATPQLQSGSISLTPQYDTTTGELVAYHVTDVVADDSNISIMIPDYVGTVPVTKITEGAFDDFDNLHAVLIPGTVTTLEKDMFPGSSNIINTGRQTVTIYYEGTKAQWDALEKVDGVDEGSWFLDPDVDISWDNSLGKGSRVFFIGADGKVDILQGYYEVTSISGGAPADVKWTHYSTITQEIKNQCTANCDCDEVCKGEKQRPDAIYWEGVVIE